jgi:predicted Zn-dependent peptidase
MTRAAAPIWTDAAGDPHLAIRRRRLPCGLEVILHHDPSASEVAVSMWYRVGSSDEAPGTSGRAHLFEHLFKNSAHLAGRHHYEVLRAVGASDANASTSTERTAYHEVVPATQLALALWLESDRLGYFLPGLDHARLAAQQDVVRAERRQRYENVPYGAARFAVAGAIYPEGHPLRHLTIGRHEDIAATTRDDLAAFYATWYVPANATLVVAGGVALDEADALVERFFGTFPASRAPIRATPTTPPRAAPVMIELDDRLATLRRLHRVYPAPAAFAADDAALDILSAAWAATGTGALWRRLVYEAPLAQRVGVANAGGRLGGEFHVTVELRGGADPAVVRAILDEELAAVRDAPLPDAAIARVLTRHEASSLWSLQGLAARAGLLQYHAHHQGDPDGLAADLARYRTVTAAEVQAAAARWLTPAAVVEVESVPAR